MEVFWQLRGLIENGVVEVPRNSTKFTRTLMYTNYFEVEMMKTPRKKRTPKENPMSFQVHFKVDRATSERVIQKALERGQNVSEMFRQFIWDDTSSEGTGGLKGGK